MGVYLSKPVRDKVSSNYENNFLKCGASSMQGWRDSQEDAHNCCLDFDGDISLFAVYDGHGGHEVAQYASLELPQFIKEQESFKNQKYEEALKESFLGFDATLRHENVVERLKKIAKESHDKSSDGFGSDVETSEDESDVQRLREEANIPLKEIFAKYSSIPKTPSTRRLGLGETSKSPFLRAKTSSSTDSAVAEVSSSSGEIQTTSNGLPDSNGEVYDNQVNEIINCATEDHQVTSSSSDQNGEIVDSTSPDQTQGEGEIAVNSTNNEASPEQPASPTSTPKANNVRISKKKAVQCIINALMPDALKNSAEFGGESTDSEDSEDSTFQTTMPSSSSDEDETTENGNDEDEEEEEEEDEEEEEEDTELEDSLKENEEPGMNSGCTAVVALVTKDKLYVANAGDSRAVLCRSGVAIDMSVDHKPEDALELDRIRAAGGNVTCDGRVNGGLNLSRALGDHIYKLVPEIDATQQMITALPDIKSEIINSPENEFIVLACDGIWNSMTSQEVVDFIRPLITEGCQLSTICEQLFEKCLAPDTRGDGTGCDNMTCVIVQFRHNSDKEPEQEEQSLKRTAEGPGENTDDGKRSNLPSTKKARVELVSESP